MNSDDVTAGQLLTRREALSLFGAAGAVVLTGYSASSVLAAAAADGSNLPGCIVRPEQTEGPYFVDEKLNRSDIRSDPMNGVVKQGTPFRLTVKVSQISRGRCTPIAGAVVDLWHCDAFGVYSDVRDPGFRTTGQKFLRGYQVTDDSGQVKFITIYPGWYSGRTVHIHFKIRIRRAYLWDYDFTSQWYFDDPFTDRVYTRAPYSGRGPRNVRNRDDGIFRYGGEQLMLAPVESGDGYAATFDIGLQIG
ncbi:MAG: intradiol ring-cleavage dioxygenase [Nitrospirae bacterium]|nr:intradiol ring-cleavage dioxygenase [Nitrospirota bacterium]